MQQTNDIGASGATSNDRGQELGEPVEIMKERARHLADKITQGITRSIDFIHSHPIASVCISLSLGFYSRTLLRLGLLAGAGTLVSRGLSRLSGRGRPRAAAARAGAMS